jgi:DNA topoisomerase-1
MEIFLDYNFTAKVEQDFDEIAEEISFGQNDAEFYDQFHPTIER